MDSLRVLIAKLHVGQDGHVNYKTNGREGLEGALKILKYKCAELTWLLRGNHGCIRVWNTNPAHRELE